MNTTHPKFFSNIKEEMKNSLQFKLGIVTKIVFKKMNAQLVQEGIPVLAEQLPILMVVYFQEHAMTQQDIANLLQKDKAGIQRSVQTLHKDGFLKIESDIEDKRKNLVTLTASGKFVCERIQSLVIAFDNRVMEHFTEEERKTFMGYLDRVAAVAEK
ncbi:MarR family winged helix-turn-helix transcriptional regulator [Dyadobacter fanqingshengii]|uniref:MarR family transcriptional regulator n=1 Tax=Dyadobacter fanqingshengii TaxID=2906443 RepID=A0A9X1P640_9BACT|nr:MarR family transcriptional regulator [Dyadobacter fanqingshengii]MCF0038642.1 MarR family transcriptional regulator [Dyadobacter fanqingshengii]MCF2503828.1 MarR family transcriptional regulator [Dyadobacter fanqingshengii]USJ34525.1 MarR family transcriptional regulator [Dyadobacter fanqingshengii]